MLQIINMAMSSPASDKHRQNAINLSGRLKSCWSVDINWDLYPSILKQGCAQAGKAISMPPSAVLYGILVIVSFTMSHSAVEVEVSGEANFDMAKTGLTLGGFIQPSIVKGILEQPSNAEKGLCQRFLWFTPKPTPVPFNQLEKADRDFSASIVGLMSALWSENHTVKVWKLPRPCESFRLVYDKVQDQLQNISCMDTLLSGLLSKSKGQVLRVAAVLHVLFHLETPVDIPEAISDAAVTAAHDLVTVCIQHAAFLAGRRDIDSEIEAMIEDQSEPPIQPRVNSESNRNASMCLLIPGETLHLNALLSMRKFRDRGNKAGAVKAFELLEESGLGVVISTKPQRGASMMYQFKKANVPTDSEEKMTFCDNLLKFGVSLIQYEKARSMDDITMTSLESRKRKSDSPTPPPRRSPRKNLFD